VTERYVPEAGEYIWISLDPIQGREQGGRRPFLVLSPRDYNEKTSLVVGVPVTSKRKGYPFEVQLPAHGVVAGVVLADHLRSLDWRVRVAELAEAADPNTVRDVRALIATFLLLR
jgi:mRNA interferase MazF